jgi:hypothetical protein
LAETTFVPSIVSSDGEEKMVPVQFQIKSKFIDELVQSTLIWDFKLFVYSEDLRKMAIFDFDGKYHHAEDN